MNGLIKIIFPVFVLGYSSFSWAQSFGEQCEWHRNNIVPIQQGGGSFDFRLCCANTPEVRCRIAACDDNPVMGDSACPEVEDSYFPGPWNNNGNNGGGSGGSGGGAFWRPSVIWGAMNSRRVPVGGGEVGEIIPE